MNMRTPKPLVTIAVPTHDRPAMLVDAVRSCLAQTMTDLEVVVSDNASAVSAETALGGISDPRLRIVRLDDAVSGTENWNNALRHARGQFVTFLCDDNVLLPHFLEVMLPSLLDDADCALVTAPWFYTDAELRLLDQELTPIGRFYPILRAEDFVSHVLGLKRALGLDGVLCATESLREVGGFREVGFNGPWCADHHAWFRVALTGKFVRTVDQSLYLYRTHRQSETTAAVRSSIASEARAYAVELAGLRSRVTDETAFDAAQTTFFEWLETWAQRA